MIYECNGGKHIITSDPPLYNCPLCFEPVRPLADTYEQYSKFITLKAKYALDHAHD